MFLYCMNDYDKYFKAQQRKEKQDKKVQEAVKKIVNYLPNVHN